MLWFLILGGLLAFGFGVWLGLPGRYTQTPEDIERIMDGGVGRRRKRKERFTPLAWLQRRAQERGSHQRRSSRGRGGFHIEPPDER